MRGRKRVVAREVHGSEVEAANRQAAAMTPGDIYTPDVPTDRSEAASVVDPTTLGQRYRRSSHHRIYRWTQVSTMLCGALAVTSFIFTMLDEPIAGRSIAGGAMVIGVMAVWLASRTSLSARWRGWAIAALVFAAAALAMSWIGPAVTREDPSDLKAQPLPRTNG